MCMAPQLNSQCVANQIRGILFAHKAKQMWLGVEFMVFKAKTNRKWNNGCSGTSANAFWKFGSFAHGITKEWLSSLCYMLRVWRKAPIQHEICIMVLGILPFLRYSHTCMHARAPHTESSIDFPSNRLTHHKIVQTLNANKWKLLKDFHWYAYHEIIVYIERLIRVPAILSHFEDNGRMHRLLYIWTQHQKKASSIPVLSLVRSLKNMRWN